MRSSRLCTALLAFAAVVALFARLAAQDPARDAPTFEDLDAALPAEDRAALQGERESAELRRRRGDARAAIAVYDQHLADEPRDVESLALRALARRTAGDVRGAWNDAHAAFEHAFPALGTALDGSPEGSPDRPLDLPLELPLGRPEVRARVARIALELELERGRAAELTALVDRSASVLDPAADPRAAWLVAGARLELGARSAAEDAWRAGTACPAAEWGALLGRARCRRALGDLEGAAQDLVAADRATARSGSEPDVLSELASIYFEADGEVESDASASRSPGALYREALSIAPGHEDALIGLAALARFNWRRGSRSSSAWLGDVFARAPDSVRAQLAALSNDLDDGDLKSARERIARLEGLGVGTRALTAERAALAWIEHRRDDCAALHKALLDADARDPAPERVLGGHLVELYRFAEAREPLARAVARDPRDFEAWMLSGRALANSGDEAAGLAALEQSERAAAGRQNAWRSNMVAVLRKLRDEYRVHKAGPLSFAWSADEAALHELYQVEHYDVARAELAARYGFTPQPTHIEVFREHADFSVRSTGFEGFPALGVCFGPVVTAVSPLCHMRGKFSWARTSFHEFTHVIHLGLSHNRCPRWITEGLATWEEENRDPSWTRNMRRELLDARAAGELIPVRQLNRAFRGPRILFGYYQGGLLCRMLIDQHGFAPMVRLLEAFDRGLDLDQAFAEVFHATPEAVDASFAIFVDAHLARLSCEPRRDPLKIAAQRLALSRRMPEDPQARRAWARDWLDVAWGSYQTRDLADAEDALRRALSAEGASGRAEVLLGNLAFARDDSDGAKQHWRRAFALGHEDYQARMGLARMLERDDPDAAEAQYLFAEAAFPGWDDPEFSAELSLARLYERKGQVDDAMRARERWLVYESGDLSTQLAVAGWHAASGRPREACAYFQAANEIDPFVHALHEGWGDALVRSGEFERALREFKAALLVPPELDADARRPLDDAGRARLLEKQALALVALERPLEAVEVARAALALDAKLERAQEIVERGGALGSGTIPAR
jgi:predicted Zn-dependent protease